MKISQIERRRDIRPADKKTIIKYLNGRLDRLPAKQMAHQNSNVSAAHVPSRPLTSSPRPFSSASSSRPSTPVTTSSQQRKRIIDLSATPTVLSHKPIHVPEHKPEPEPEAEPRPKPKKSRSSPSSSRDVTPTANATLATQPVDVSAPDPSRPVHQLKTEFSTDRSLSETPSSQSKSTPRRKCDRDDRQNCFICYGHKHLVKDCPERKDFAKVKARLAAASSDMTTEAEVWFEWLKRNGQV